jgi:hypothetical protein
MDTIMHQTQSSRFLIGFRMKLLQDAGIDHGFLWINPVEKSPKRKSDAMTSLGDSARSAIYYKAGSPLNIRVTGS